MYVCLYGTSQHAVSAARVLQIGHLSLSLLYHHSVRPSTSWLVWEYVSSVISFLTAPQLRW